MQLYDYVLSLSLQSFNFQDRISEEFSGTFKNMFMLYTKQFL